MLSGLHEQDARTRDALLRVCDEGTKPSSIYVARTFSRLKTPLPADQYSDRNLPPRHLRPPAAQLIRSKGVAQQFILTALFEAQCAHGRAGTRQGVNQRPLAPRSRAHVDDAAWTDLILTPTAEHAPAAVRAVSRTDRRLRQIREALGTLASLELIALPEPGIQRDRYQQFQLLHEAPRPVGDPVPYRVPAPGWFGLFALDVAFFTSGWIHVLEPSEIAFLCMLQAHRDSPTRWPDRKLISIRGRDRVRYYGLGADAYRSHILLEDAGLLEVLNPVKRRPNGTVVGFDPHKPPPPMEFRIIESAFAQPALPAMLGALRRRAEQLGDR